MHNEWIIINYHYYESTGPSFKLHEMYFPTKQQSILPCLNSCMPAVQVTGPAAKQNSPFLPQRSITQSIIILSEQMQKHCSHCTSIWGDITCREMTVKKVTLSFCLNVNSVTDEWWRHFWRKTVPGFCRHNTERSITDCLKMCLWHSKIRWWRRTQTLSTWKIGDMAQAVTQICRDRTPHTPKCQYFQLERYLLCCTKASAAGDLVIPTRTKH